MIDQKIVLSNIQNFRQRGAYQELTQYIDTLPKSLLTQFAIALAYARACMRQKPIVAEKILAQVDIGKTTPSQKLVLFLESMTLKIFQKSAFREAVQSATNAINNASSEVINSNDWPEIQYIYTRILLMGVIYAEGDPQLAKQMHTQLPRLADVLEEKGKIEISLYARFLFAESLKKVEEKQKALAEFAGIAIRLNRFDLAAEAYLYIAELLLKQGGTSEKIRTMLIQANTYFNEVNHVHGSIDVKRVSALLAIERELAGKELLQTCLEDYQRIDYAKGTLDILMALSQLAHQQGQNTQAVAYRQACLTLAEEVGMELMRDNFQLAQADLLQRNGKYSDMIALCQSALEKNPSPIMEASYTHFLATAYSHVNNYEKSLQYARQTMDTFIAIGKEDSATNSVEVIAHYLDATRQDVHWKEAETLLNTWFDKDVQQNRLNSAVTKLELHTQIFLNRYNFSSTEQHKTYLLEKANKTIESAFSLAAQLPKQLSAKRMGNIYQLRGQLKYLAGDSQAIEKAWEDALKHFKSASLLFEAANCHYMLGVINLNAANRQLMPHFGTAEQHLQQALNYYEEAKMRVQATDGHYMLALLYFNAALQLRSDNQQILTQLFDATIEHLNLGEHHQDNLRRDYSTGTVLEALEGKRALIEKNQRLYHLALKIAIKYKTNSELVWEWIQRNKARALVDTLGSVARMVEKPELKTYLQLRIGEAINQDELDSLLASHETNNYSIICIDWVLSENDIFLVSKKRDQSPTLVKLDYTLEQLQTFIDRHLNRHSFRQTLHDAPQLLRELDILIAPLAYLTHPEEQLVLVPTGPLHAIPLHALEIDGNALLERNPIVYCPSLSILRHCLNRRKPENNQTTAAIFGDPNRNLAQANLLVQHLGKLFNTQPLFAENVTRQNVIQAIMNCEIIHFQGHAVHNTNDPLDSSLKLADSNLTAREIFELEGLQAELVTLTACESAVNIIAAGDEPLGLIPAFLYTGAGAVLATLWQVHQKSASHIMQRFYEIWDNNDLSKAQALRQAMLTVKSMPEFSSPYHWAPFVLQGDWQ